MLFQRSTIITASVLTMSVLVACSRAPVQQARTPDTAPAAAPATLPAIQPSRTGHGDEAPRTVTGTVVETMNAANYTYVRVKTAEEELWAATAQFEVKVGERVTVPLEMAMENFHSQTLNRDFPSIYFVSQIAREGASPHRTQPASAADSPPVTTPMQPPPGGTTVANVWADRKTLAGRPVTVRGKVTKYNGGILGVNWVHIQDGTGTAGQKTNDLAVTTGDTASVGDIVTASGILAIDKDFGAGYAYPVILEKSVLKR